jgi:hypothetical protein
MEIMNRVVDGCLLSAVNVFINFVLEFGEEVLALRGDVAASSAGVLARKLTWQHVISLWHAEQAPNPGCCEVIPQMTPSLY